MLTQEQENWLAGFNTNDSVQVFPYDPRCQDIFEEVKKTIQNKLGESIKIEHHGASSLGISGQDEIDIYILVSTAEFNDMVLKVSSLFGEPKSISQTKRARFRTDVDNKKIDLFVSNAEHEEWKKHVKFKQYLLDNSEALQEYKEIKENSSGKSSKEYYRVKLEFINRIFEQMDK